MRVKNFFIHLNFKTIIYLIILINFIKINILFANNSISRQELNWSYKILTSDIINDDIPFYDEDENPIYLDKYEDTNLLIVFWASWMPNSNNYMKLLDNLKKDFKKVNFEIIAISEDYLGINKILDFYKQNNIRHLKPYLDHNNKLLKSLPDNSVPISYLIPKNQQNIIQIEGRIEWNNNQIRDFLLSYSQSSPIPKNTYKNDSLSLYNSEN